MSTSLPDAVDVTRMVSGRRSFEGELPLARFARLREFLRGCGSRWSAVMDSVPTGLSSVPMRWEFSTCRSTLNATATVMLQCQRTLEPFPLPLAVEQRLGFIRRESGLPDEYEPLLMPEDRQLHLAELIEDELILSLPLVPVSAGVEQVDSEEDAVVYSTGEVDMGESDG